MVIVTWMIYIMSSCRYKQTEAVKSSHFAYLFSSSLNQEVENALDNIGCMRAVVVGIFSISCLESEGKVHVSFLINMQVFLEIEFLGHILQHEVKGISLGLFL